MISFKHLILLIALLYMPGLLQAASEGFHYVPLRMNSAYLNTAPAYKDVEFNIVIANLGESVYRGSGDEAIMTGLGAIFHRTWLNGRFVAFSPQYGFNLFVGVPKDASGDPRARMSLQAPLGLHYVFQLYRDDRFADAEMSQSRSFGFYAGVLTPLIMDFTIDSFAFAADLGGQLGLTYSLPLPRSVLQMSAGIAKFLSGVIYLVDNDTGEDEWDDIDGEPVDLGVGLKYLYLPWDVAIGANAHFTSSLADTQGDSIFILSFNVTYFPK